MYYQRAPFRLPRTAAMALSVMSLAAGAHLLGGGRLPPAPVLAASAALVVLAVVVLTRWKLKSPAVGAVLTGGQVLLHALFSALSPSAAEGPALPAAILGGHQHSVVSAVGHVPVGENTHLHLLWDLGPAMLTAHLAATLATALMLARGEAALWALAAWLRPVRFLSPVTFVHPSPVPVRARRQVVPRRAVPRAHPRRGPPANA